MGCRRRRLGYHGAVLSRSAGVLPVAAFGRFRPGRGRVAFLLLLALLPPLAFLAAEAWLFDGDWQFPLDDSWIHLVFARSLAHGEGLAFNPQELVAGTTAPLWTALLGLLAALPGSILLWTKLAGIAAQAASVLLVYSVGRRLDLSPALATVAAGLVAATDWLVWSSISGMEVNLFVLLMLAGLNRHLREQTRHRPTRACRRSPSCSSDSRRWRAPRACCCRSSRPPTGCCARRQQRSGSPRSSLVCDSRCRRGPTWMGVLAGAAPDAAGRRPGRPRLPPDVGFAAAHHLRRQELGRAGAPPRSPSAAGDLRDPLHVAALDDAARARRRRRVGAPVRRSARPRPAARALDARSAARLGDALVGKGGRGRELRALLLPAAALRGAARPRWRSRRCRSPVCARSGSGGGACPSAPCCSCCSSPRRSSRSPRDSAATSPRAPTSATATSPWRAGSDPACRPTRCSRSTTSAPSSTSCRTGSSTSWG